MIAILEKWRAHCLLRVVDPRSRQYSPHPFLENGDRSDKYSTTNMDFAIIWYFGLEMLRSVFVPLNQQAKC
jgi:hypothetical protein